MKYAAVTFYFPTIENVENINKISKQVDYVLIMDNSPFDNKNLLLSIENVKYYCVKENLGISKAFNYLLKNESILFNDEDYIIFFDQDSTIEENHIDNLINDYNELIKNNYKVACLGPIYYERNSNKVKIQKLKKELLPSIYSVKSIITSSMLCRYKELKEINFWNEDVFLDMSDWDLCWRFIEKGYLCCVTSNVILTHTLGENSKNVGAIKLKVGKEIRDYYQVRESLYLFDKTYTPLKFKLRFILMLVVRNPLRLIFLDNRKERLHYMVKGIKDHKNKKYGCVE